LIPILDSLKITKTNLWQSILWIATMDDIFEVFSVIIVVAFLPMLVANSGFSVSSISAIVIPLVVLFAIVALWISIVFLMKKLSKHKEMILKYEIFFSMVLFFLFIGLWSLADMSAIWAIVWWLVANEILNSKDRKIVEHYVKNIAYYFLWPIFFFSIGAEIDLSWFKSYFPLILVFSLVPYLVKIFVSYLNWRKKLWSHKSIYMWIALWVRFSTSIVILTLFLQKNIISAELFSILISTTIVLKFVIPVLLSFLAR